MKAFAVRQQARVLFYGITLYSAQRTIQARQEKRYVKLAMGSILRNHDSAQSQRQACR